MAIPRARGGTSPSTRWSPMWISPEVGRSSPAIMRSSVVFPEPEEPSRTRNSPSRIDRSTPSTAWRSPKCFLRLRISMPATVAALTPGLPPVGSRIRRFRQVDRRRVDEVVRARRHHHRLYDFRRRAGRRRRPPAGATAAGQGRKDNAAEKCNPHAQSDVHRFPLLATGGGPFIRKCVVRRGSASHPVPERVRVVRQAPLLEDRQRHGPHPALAAAGGQALLVQPRSDCVGLGVGGTSSAWPPAAARAGCGPWRCRSSRSGAWRTTRTRSGTGWLAEPRRTTHFLMKGPPPVASKGKRCTSLCACGLHFSAALSLRPWPAAVAPAGGRRLLPARRRKS